MLLREPLEPAHLKPRLLEHGGTCPGGNLVHTGLNGLVRMKYPLPAPWRRRFGLRRYGFHGLSYSWALPSCWRGPEVRAAVCAELGLLGVPPAAGANRDDDGAVSPLGVSPPVFVVQPQKELSLAQLRGAVRHSEGRHGVARPASSPAPHTGTRPAQPGHPP